MRKEQPFAISLPITSPVRGDNFSIFQRFITSNHPFTKSLIHELFFPGAEGTALCDIIANNLNRWRTQVRGTIVLNGVSIDPSKLQDRVAYVRTDNNFAPDMSVRQTMLFHAFLREPGSHSRYVL